MSVELKDLLEAGAHFGHQTRRWNPKMGRFIYGTKGGIHVIDLIKTAEQLRLAEEFAQKTAAAGGSILFVGTKRQGKAIVAEEAKAAGMPYVVERWLGGMLTNARTIRNQVNRLKKLEGQAASGELAANYNKKEVLDLEAEIERLNFIFGGIKDLDEVPAALFVLDAQRERIAVAEACKLDIPVIAIVDTNADPDLIDYPIPANDDALRAIKLLTHAIGEAAAKGRAAYQASSRASQDEGVEGAAKSKAAAR